MPPKSNKVVRKWRCTRSGSETFFTVGKVYREYADKSFEDNLVERWGEGPVFDAENQEYRICDLPYYAFEEVKKEETSMFDKNTLVIGDVIELKRGKQYILMPQSEKYKGHYAGPDLVFINITMPDWRSFASVQNNEIVRVYRRQFSSDFPRDGKVSYGNENKDSVIYDATKSKVKELTVEEISKLLGYDVKVVKG